MTLAQLGRRYERLLFFSGPLTLVTVAVLLVAWTSSTQRERVLARCLDVAVATLQQNDAQLNSKWEQYQAQKKKSKYFVNEYRYELTKVWISPGIHSGCHAQIKPLLEEGAETKPDELAKNFARRANELKNTPLQFRGIEIPQKAEISLFGTNIKIAFDTLAAALQISLVPVLLIWLGSLYNTRYRESLLIGTAADITSVFPHLINVYPAGEVPTLRKRSSFAYWVPLRTLICVMYSITRLGLISFVIGPAVACYLISLFLRPIEDAFWASFVAGGVVAIFSLSVLIAELFPWHARKIFPDTSKR